MLALVGTVLVTSFLDSLNPSAIAQELLLLAIAPRKHDVWWFIIGIALANLALGFAIYLGIAALVTEVFPHCSLLIRFMFMQSQQLLDLFWLLSASALSYKQDHVEKPLFRMPLTNQQILVLSLYFRWVQHFALSSSLAPCHTLAL